MSSAPNMGSRDGHPSGFVVAVVDDDPSILRSLGSLLESADHPVRLFSSGAELLASSDLPEIACLISDVEMPGMGGLELLRRFHERRPGRPIILITGYPETLTRSPVPDVTVLRVFTKPFDGHEVLMAVSDALRAASE